MDAGADDTDRGYVAINRTWTPGDAIALNLPMPVRRVVAHEQVRPTATASRCSAAPSSTPPSGPTIPTDRVRNIVLPDASALTAEYPRGPAERRVGRPGRAVGLAIDEKGVVQKTEQPFMAIPYATWANRGRGQMAVWLARTEAAARPTPYPTIATTSVTASPIRAAARTSAT